MKNSSSNLKFAIIATDIAIFTIKNGKLCVRLMTVDRPPHFVNQPGLPGGLIRPDETAEESAKRIVREKGFINDKNIYLEQLFTFSRINRDPRGRVVAVAYIALVSWDKISQTDDESYAYWTPVEDAINLAYDHDEILLTAINRIKARLHYTTIIGKLLPSEFTLTELELVYENILGKKLDKRNFRKKILKIDILKPTSKKRADGAYRPALLYKMASKKVDLIEVI
jgi:8-oxo-dGTP diphosphatase